MSETTYTTERLCVLVNAAKRFKLNDVRCVLNVLYPLMMVLVCAETGLEYD